MGERIADGGESWFLNKVWPKLVSFALEMNTLFSESEMTVLSGPHEQRKIVLSRRQVACLVVHQFLGAFVGPPSETEAFKIFESGIHRVVDMSVLRKRISLLCLLTLNGLRVERLMWMIRTILSLSD